MAITHTKTVTNLIIFNNPDKIVSEVEVNTKSVDDSDPERLTIESTDSITLDTTGITTSTVGFTTFANLTQSQILGWAPVVEWTGETNTEVNHTSWIESVKNPPAPAKVNESLPW
tara:strand:+ start:556 stop:900 length:345 start_codon:yes stop_codon:yes gene_type:complete